MPPSILWLCTSIFFDNFQRNGPDHLKPRFEILHQWTCYFIHTLEWSFWILKVCKALKTHAPVNTLAGYKFTFWQLPREWAKPSKTSIGNTSPMNMLLCTHIGVIISNCKRMQSPQNSCPRKRPSWIQVYFLTTSKGMDQPIWNLDLKYFTNEYAILYMHWSKFLSHTNSSKLVPRKHFSWMQV